MQGLAISTSIGHLKNKIRLIDEGSIIFYSARNNNNLQFIHIMTHPPPITKLLASKSRH